MATTDDAPPPLLPPRRLKQLVDRRQSEPVSLIRPAPPPLPARSSPNSTKRSSGGEAQQPVAVSSSSVPLEPERLFKPKPKPRTRFSIQNAESIVRDTDATTSPDSAFPTCSSAEPSEDGNTDAIEPDSFADHPSYYGLPEVVSRQASSDTGAPNDDVRDLGGDPPTDLIDLETDYEQPSLGESLASGVAFDDDEDDWDEDFWNVMAPTALYAVPTNATTAVSHELPTERLVDVDMDLPPQVPPRPVRPRSDTTDTDASSSVALPPSKPDSGAVGSWFASKASKFRKSVVMRTARKSFDAAMMLDQTPPTNGDSLPSVKSDLPSYYGYLHNATTLQLRGKKKRGIVAFYQNNFRHILDARKRWCSIHDGKFFVYRTQKVWDR